MAKSFNFSLKKVLKYRIDQEDLKASDLKKSKAALRLEKNRLKHLQTKKSNHLGETEDLINDEETISIERLKTSSDYLAQLNEKISNQDDKVEKSNQKVNQIRKELIETSKNRKILEKLREKHYTNYKEQSKKEERRIESEIALRRRKRKNDIEE